MRLRVGERRLLWINGVKAVVGEDLVPADEAAEGRWMPESGEAIEDILGEGIEGLSCCSGRKRGIACFVGGILLRID
ncbi:hypothetical protein IEQ34_001332 [Dendrobium chrysotoxum]|uniref:Uncharacterized protein n=1 Tax=Dendrobium chrysotoxum TaxID=161865 RepID=A0AAV7HPS4_DENCH|nr:hypothetical protein IEQ34_001332 [Dendrobium chrysotoxum]